MELETLRWLVEVADGATVTETAARFHTTQPAVTRALQRLGRQHATPLTERDGRRLKLTYAGEIVVAAARRALAELDAAAAAVKEASDPATGTVRLGFLSPLGHAVVPSLLTGFRRQHPLVNFKLRQDGAERISAALQQGELDLLLSDVPSSPSFSWEPLIDEEIVIAVASAHPLATRRQVRVAELSQEQWVLMNPGFGLRARVEQLCGEAGFSPQVAFEGHDLTTLYALIASGSGIGLFARGAAFDDSGPAPVPAGIRELQLVPRQRRKVGLITVPERVRAPSADAFIGYVREQLGPRT
jgi:DNA-binding transcriptional LysR family regulator